MLLFSNVNLQSLIFNYLKVQKTDSMPYYTN